MLRKGMSEAHPGQEDLASGPAVLSPEDSSAFHAALRDRTGKAAVWTAAISNVLYLAGTGLDYLLAREQWLFFLGLRAAAVVISTLAAILASRPSLRHRSWEAFWVMAVSYGGFMGPMLPLSGANLALYLMGFSVVIFGAGILPLWHPRWIVSSLAAMLILAAVSFLVIPSTVQIEDALGGLFVVATAAGLSVAGTVFKYQILKHDFAATLSLSRVTRQLQDTNDQLGKLSVTDPLTGLHNRRFVGEMLENELARAKRYDRPLACLMVDLDHFKKVNDAFGRRTGDQVLILVAGVLSGSMRRSDILGRYGGEEFLVMAPETDAEGALQLAERLRLKVAEGSKREGEPLPPVTISVGVAATDRTGFVTPEELVQVADTSLYAAKEQGRNCVVCL